MIGLMFHYNIEDDSRFFVDYTFWDDFLAIWGFDLLIMITDNPTYDLRENTFSTIDEAMEKFSSYEFIALDPAGSIKLRDYTHPTDNVIYIVGDDQWIVSKMPDVTKIRIDTPVDSNVRPLRAFSVANGLAFHRHEQVD